MTKNVEEVLQYAVRDAKLCDKFIIWSMKNAIKGSNALVPSPSFSPVPLSRDEVNELLAFLRNKVKIAAEGDMPAILGRMFTGAEVIYVISHAVGGSLSRDKIIGRPPGPPPPWST